MEFLLLNVAFVSMFYFKHGAFHHPFDSLLLYVNVAWLIAVAITKPYDIKRSSSLFSILVSVSSVLLMHMLLVFAFYVFQQQYRYSRELLVMFYSGSFGAIMLYRVAFHMAIRQFRKKGFNYRNIVLVMHEEEEDLLSPFIGKRPEYGYHVKQVIRIPASDRDRTNDIIRSKCEGQEIHEIFFPISMVNYTSLANLIHFAEESLIRVRLVADFRWINFTDLEIERIGDLPVIKLHTTPLDNWNNQLLKRIFDIVFSSLVIIGLLSWLMPLLALAVKLDSRGPVFFRQKRTGRDNKSFWCYKLRTMYVNKESDEKQATRNDSRITKVGSFLRNTSLDELPQFFNVLLGDMSVVGPRPHMLKHTTEFSAEVDRFMERHKIKPGITGLAQSRGYRGETDDFEKLKNRVKLDLFYVNNWTFLFDIKIIYDTVRMILRGS
ncbi:MAG: undecaprenyl-phosphate glucose phosphotransferase [Bacteroidota bacterium]